MRDLEIGSKTLLLLGNLKVGKTTLLYALAGSRTRPVRLPGVERELEAGTIGAGRFESLLDVPGCGLLSERSADAALVRAILAERRVGGVLLVLDAKNLRRGLALCQQLAEYRLPAVAALNMVDEAGQRGVDVDAATLSQMLGIPVVPTVAVERQNLAALRRTLEQAAPLSPAIRVAECPEPDELEATSDCFAKAEALAKQVTRLRPVAADGFGRRLARLTRRPLTGVPIALLALALLYLFVGWFGAGVLVEWIEGGLFQGLLLPPLLHLSESIPWPWMREMLLGQFGVISVGLVLSVGIVLPALLTFYLAMALMEDSGYLPRLSLLMDRLMRRIGLTGKGLLPLIMGFSCVTAALLATRTLDTRKQRLVAVLLLVLGIPCAPLISVAAVVFARLRPGAALLYLGVIVANVLVIGIVANRLLPGKRGDLIVELPPLRWPRISNLLVKTGWRTWWFLREAVPFFILGCLALYALDRLGGLSVVEAAMRPVLEDFLGLPPDSAALFLMSMVRREAGGALLLPQVEAGLYDGVQVVVTLVVMTLMIPCVNAALACYRVQGFWRATGMLLLTIPWSLTVGALVHFGCRAAGWNF